MQELNEVSAVNYDEQLTDSVKNLIDGYMDYATYIILQRAIVGIDGFKPVQRRALYTAKYKTKATGDTKSSTLVGDTVLIHPHGGGAVYLTVCRMIEGTGYYQTPFFIGEGSFGNNSKGTKPAPERYTVLKLGPNTDDLFEDMAGINMIATEDDNYKEPDLLPVKYPTLFANATSGIAVGLSANIFPYPVEDICNYTIDLIEKGESDMILVPDFESGGYILDTPKEFLKIMNTGKGRIKLRGEWHIDKKNIVITKFPYYTNAKTIKRKIEELDLPEVKDVIEASDMGGAEVVIICKKAEYTEYVLNTIIRDTDIQMYATANTVVIVDNKPKVAGVTEITKDWINFRKGVLAKSLTARLDYILDLQSKYRVYLDLTSNNERVAELVETLKKSGSNAEKLLNQWYPDAEDEVVTWLLGLSVRNFYNPKKNRESLEKLETEERAIRYNLENLDKLIVKQLKEMASKHKRERKTIITDVDYTYDKKVSDDDAVVPVEVTIKDKFITKRTYVAKQQQEAGSFRCLSDDIVVIIDTLGRVIRVDLRRLDYTAVGSKGTYLPVYLEVEDDFNLVWATILEPKKVGFMYSDGKASVLDLNEWIGLRHTKRIVTQGISEYANRICGLINLEKDYTLVFTSLGRIGLVENNFKQKGRTSRTSVLRMNTQKGEKITRVYGVNNRELLPLLRNYVHYIGKLSYLEYEDSLNKELLKELN